MELTQKQISAALDKPAVITDLGSELAFFQPQQLAQVLELETNKAAGNGLSHLKITMNLSDAVALAAFLRRGSN